MKHRTRRASVRDELDSATTPTDALATMMVGETRKKWIRRAQDNTAHVPCFTLILLHGWVPTHDWA